MDQLLVILDLDETLVHSPDSPLLRSPDFIAGPHPVYERPGLRPFLYALLSRYVVGVWTAAGRDYASAVLDHIAPPDRPLAFFWSSERCTRRFDHETRQHFTVKPLRKVAKLGFNLDRVVVVDDSPEKHVLNYGNLVRIAPFLGDTDDRHLGALLPYLDQLALAPNVRVIEKRHWSR